MQVNKKKDKESEDLLADDGDAADSAGTGGIWNSISKLVHVNNMQSKEHARPCTHLSCSTFTLYMSGFLRPYRQTDEQPALSLLSFIPVFI